MQPASHRFSLILVTTLVLPAVGAATVVAQGEGYAVTDTERACSGDDDCTIVSAHCCACGSEDYAAANAGHLGAVGDRLRPDCEDAVCPSMMCQPVYAVCQAGLCVATHEPSQQMVVCEEIESFVLASQRAGHVRHEREPYLQEFTEDAQIVAARSSEPGPHDWSLSRPAIESRSVRFGAPPDPSRTLRFERLRCAVEADLVELRVRTTLRSDGAIETVEEIYRLRSTDRGWRVFENRWWPISATFAGSPVQFDEAYWTEADARVDAARTADDVRQESLALLDAYRFPEAYDALQRLTAGAGASASDWLSRGFIGMLTGHADDALAAFQRARELDSSLPVPAYVP